MDFPTRLDRWCAEPFRVFFPLGFLASCIGVLLWPASYAGYLPEYPLEAHSRWMIPAFAGCMMTGFLGTAGPRLLDSAPWSRFEFFLHLTMALAVMSCLVFFETGKADFLTCFWLLGVLGSLAWRALLDRHDIPPPGLPLVFLGFLTTAVSAFALGLSPLVPLRYEWHQFWRLLYFQGFLWLPITGVAPYLLPRFFGRSSLHSFPTNDRLPSGWLKHFTFTAITGALIIGSFAIEAFRDPAWGQILRAIVVSVFLISCVPGLLSFKKMNALALAVRWILPATVSGWLLVPLWPHFRIGISHLMLIAGAGGLILAVSTRVILGHHDRHDRLSSPLRWYHLIWSGLLLTAATRLSADFIPNVRTSHLIYAAALWVILLVFWAIKVRRELMIPPPEDREPRPRCPKRPQKSTRTSP